MPNTLLTLLSAELIERYYAAGFWRDDTIYSLVHAHAEHAPDKFAVRERFRRITYRDLISMADTLAADLARRGVRAGQRVGVWLPSRAECAVALLACSRNGTVCCPSMHRGHTVGEIFELLRRTRAAALIAQPGYGADAQRHDIFAQASKLSSLRHCCRLDPLTEMSPAVVFDRVATSNVNVAPKQDPNQVVYLAFTSGTTGQPKGVMHSDNTLLANARAIAADWSIDADSVVYSLSPLSHNLGFGAMVMALAAGAEFVVHDLPKAESLADRVAATGTSFLVGVPTHAIDLLQDLKARKATNLGRLKGFRISGAAVPSVVVTGLLHHGVVPQSGYGMTEACSHHYTLPGDNPKLIRETSGRACPGYQIKIFRTDDPDVEVPVGEIGQIGGRGASLMLGYFDDQTATEQSLNSSGWFMTGDLGWVDENGYLRVTGRKTDVIIRGGHNIYPARIEALAMRHASVARAAAVPLADARLGERVCLAVMVRNDQRIEVDELLAHLDAAGLSKYDMPEYFLQLDDIPLTASGKISKRDIVEWIGQGRMKPIPVRRQPQQQQNRRHPRRAGSKP
jgi:acyl-CoA synthetase (AMP-forming)/AMP-acid ligase II